MIRLLASLFGVINKVLRLLRDSKLEEQGRQQTVKEMSAEPPRRISALRTRITLPLPADHPQRIHCNRVRWPQS